jgi:hypothetical protein
MSPVRKNIVLIVCAVVGLLSQVEGQNDSVFDGHRLAAIPLEKGSQGGVAMLPAASGELRLFIFLSPECPLCKSYTGVLNQLNRQYAGRLQVTGIIPGRTYQQEEVDSFIRKYKITYPLYIDPSLDLSHYLQASVTPQVILLDKDSRLVYKGAIDNWYKALGKPGARVTEHYLQDAIEAALHHSQPATRRTNTVGCQINDF